jgi:hypothetical protein
MTRVLLPRQNEKDLEDVPDEVREAVSFVFADSVMDALAILFPTAETAEAAGRTDTAAEAADVVTAAPAPASADDETPEASVSL